MRCGVFEERAIANVIRHRTQLQRIATGDFDDRALGVNRILLFRMRFDVRLDVVARQSRRDEMASRRIGLTAVERSVLFDLLESAAVDPEIAAQCDKLRICRRRE